MRSRSCGVVRVYPHIFSREITTPSFSRTLAKTQLYWPQDVAVDPTGRAPGRGAYLHRRPECIEEARKKGGLNRALKAQVPDSVWVDLTP